VKGFAKTLLNIFVLAGIVLGMCLVAGVAFGGYKILARKLGRRVDPDAMITLGLDGK
jgi:drug/metabolite transporter (DMT)-like permease